MPDLLALDDDGSTDYPIGGRNVKQQSLTFPGHHEDRGRCKKLLELFKSSVSFLRPLKLLLCLEEFEEWQALFIEPRYESTQGSYTPGYLLDVLDALWRFHLRDCLDFFQVRPYVLMANYVADQYARQHTKYALLGIQLPLKLIECPEGLIEVIDQGRGYFGLHHYIINICPNELISDLILEALLDGPLVGCACVFEPK
jgi:hypothetical protein